MKECPKCVTSKPLTDFYEDKRAADGRQGWCKKCQNAAPKKANTARIVRNRARHRAIADLVARHEAEFTDLYECHRVVAEREAAELADEPEAAKHYGDTPVRLRPGARQPGEKAGDRIDVARCPHCVSHHDRGHACPKCGASPSRPSGAPSRADVLALAGQGASVSEIAQRLGLTSTTVRRVLDGRVATA